MIHDRCPDLIKPNRPPDRGEDAWAAKATGAPEQPINSQFQAARIAQRPGSGSESHQTTLSPARLVARNTPTGHRHRMQRHSTPIAGAAGAAV
jgi:hypothetical protein